jgi:hypothetical protein
MAKLFGTRNDHFIFLFFKNKIKLEGEEINNFDVKIYDKHLKIKLK